MQAVIVFLLGEDRAYLSWLAHHRNGFVLDWLRKPTRKRPTIHRATCTEIKSAPTKKSHWTTGRHIKVCALEFDELLAWAKDESGGDPDLCAVCRPADAAAGAPPGDRHLTRLGKEIVDYVVEAAVIHLDRRDADYAMTVADIADYLDKTPGQIAPAVIRLAIDGYVRAGEPIEGRATLPDKCEVFPTADALRMLPAFEKMSQRKVEAELDNLTEEE